MKLEERVRTLHDEWAKDVLELWLGHLGKVQLDARIAGSVRRGDVLFTEEKPKRRHRKELGLLGQLARGLVLFEPFRNPVTSWEVATCLVKVIEHTAQRLREARRDKRKLSSVRPTVLCLITPSASKALKIEAGLARLSPDKPGVYRMAKLLNTVFVVVNELPKDSSTVWLRLLGRDEVQLEAAFELYEMHANEPLGDATLQLFAAWYKSLPPTVATNLDQESAMNWRRVYEKWERTELAKARADGVSVGIAEGKAEGIAEGKAEGKAEAVLFNLNARGLSVTAAQRKQVLACKDLAQLDQWLLASLLVSEAKHLFALGTPTRRRTQRRAA